MAVEVAPHDLRGVREEPRTAAHAVDDGEREIAARIVADMRPRSVRIREQR